MAVVSMSKQEFSRLDVLLRVQSGRLRVSDACALIGLQRRQVFRLLRGLKQDGAASLLSKRRGQPSNHRLPAEVRTLALSIVRERYGDFGPSLAAEKLAEHHGCSVSRETLRGWMIAEGLWQDRRHRLPSPHQPRRRRDCLGELVQIDCRSPIETSPASPIEMSRSSVCLRLVEVAWHDGDHDEPQRADALRALIDVADNRNGRLSALLQPRGSPASRGSIHPSDGT